MIDQIVQRCLRKSPDDRFPSMTALVQALESVAEYTSSPDRVSQVGAFQPTIVPVASAPTTLSNATGQSDLVAHPRGRWWLAATVVVVAIVGVVVAVATTSSATTVTAGTTVMHDAAIATSRVPVDAPTPPSVPIDATVAAMIDAPVAPVDAVTSTVNHSSPATKPIDRHSKPEPRHEPAQPPRYDRSD